MEKKGDKEKEAVEGGDKVEVEKTLEEAGGEKEEEESQGDDNEWGADVDLLDPGWTTGSGGSLGLLAEVSDDMVAVTIPTTATATTASDIPARFLALHL